MSEGMEKTSEKVLPTLEEVRDNLTRLRAEADKFLEPGTTSEREEAVAAEKGAGLGKESPSAAEPPARDEEFPGPEETPPGNEPNEEAGKDNRTRSPRFRINLAPPKETRRSHFGLSFGKKETPPPGKPAESVSEPEIIPATPEGRLQWAREKFVSSEENYSKHLTVLGLKGIFGGEKKAKVQLEVDQDIYERARAEFVGEDISKFIGEQTVLTDERIKIALEKKPGLYEKFSSGWKWLGEQNLEKLGWKPQGKWGRTAARGLNLRTAVSLGLLGVSYFAPPAAFLALGARRAMAGTGGAMFTSEWLKRRAEVSRTTVSEKELASMDLNAASKKLGEMTVGLRMQGKLASESADYQKLMARYEEFLRAGCEKTERAAVWLWVESNQTAFDFEKAQRGFFGGQLARRSISFAAGFGAAVGVSSVLHWLYGHETAGEAAHSAPAPGAVKDVVQAPKVPQAPPAGGLHETPPTQPSAAAEQVPRAVAGGTAPPKEAIGKALDELHKEAAVPAGAAGSIEVVVQHGEGPIHEARKAVSEYIADSGDEKLKGLTKAQRIWAEETLYRKTFGAASGYPVPEHWQTGMKVSFSRENLESVMKEASGQSQEKIVSLGKNLSPFDEKIKWPRYEVEVFKDEGGKYIFRPWEWDEGVRHVAKGASRTAKLAVEAPPGAAPAGVGLEEIAVGEERNYVPDEMIFGDGKEMNEVLDYSANLQDKVQLDEIFLGSQPEALSAAAEEATARLDAVADQFGKAFSRLDASEWRAISGLKISDMLKKTFWGATAETRWPSLRAANHLDLWRKMNLRGKLVKFMEAMDPAERERAAGMTIKEFFKTYYLEQGASKVAL